MDAKENDSSPEAKSSEKVSSSLSTEKSLVELSGKSKPSKELKTNEVSEPAPPMSGKYKQPIGFTK